MKAKVPLFYILGFPNCKFRVTFMGIPPIMMVVFRGRYWGAVFTENEILSCGAHLIRTKEMGRSCLLVLVYKPLHFIILITLSRNPVSID